MLRNILINENTYAASPRNNEGSGDSGNGTANQAPPASGWVAGDHDGGSDGGGGSGATDNRAPPSLGQAAGGQGGGTSGGRARSPEGRVPSPVMQAPLPLAKRPILDQLANSAEQSQDDGSKHQLQGYSALGERIKGSSEWQALPNGHEQFSRWVQQDIYENEYTRTPSTSSPQESVDDAVTSKAPKDAAP